jgi:hypothetical protein
VVEVSAVAGFTAVAFVVAACASAGRFDSFPVEARASQAEWECRE